MLVEVIEQQMGRETERIREHDEHAIRRARGHLLEAIEDRVLFLFGVSQAERTDRHLWERRGPHRDGRRVFDFAVPTDHPARHAAEECAASDAGVRALHDRLELVLELRSDEQEREVRDRAGERSERRIERVFGGREAGAAGRQPGSDAHRGKTSSHLKTVLHLACLIRESEQSLRVMRS